MLPLPELQIRWLYCMILLEKTKDSNNKIKAYEEMQLLQLQQPSKQSLETPEKTLKVSMILIEGANCCNIPICL